MKALALAFVLAICGDTVFNHHQYTSSTLDYVAAFFHDSADEVNGSVFRS